MLTFAGAFLIPYVLSLVCMGLPVFLFEMGSGQFSSEGPIGLWKICPLFQGETQSAAGGVPRRCTMYIM